MLTRTQSPMSGFPQCNHTLLWLPGREAVNESVEERTTYSTVSVKNESLSRDTAPVCYKLREELRYTLYLAVRAKTKSKT